MNFNGKKSSEYWFSVDVSVELDEQTGIILEDYICGCIYDEHIWQQDKEKFKPQKSFITHVLIPEFISSWEIIMESIHQYTKASTNFYLIRIYVL